MLLSAAMAVLACAPGGTPEATGNAAEVAGVAEADSAPAAAAAARGSPLILYDAPEGEAYMQALTGGLLVRDGDCVYLDHGGERSLVLFPSPRTRWDAASGTIRFGPRTLRFNEQAAFGGGEVPIGTGPQAAEARRRGCDTRRVWWASPELVRPLAPAPVPPPPPHEQR